MRLLELFSNAGRPVTVAVKWKRPQMIVHPARRHFVKSKETISARLGPLSICAREHTSAPENCAHRSRKFGSTPTPLQRIVPRAIAW